MLGVAELFDVGRMQQKCGNEEFASVVHDEAPPVYAAPGKIVRQLFEPYEGTCHDV